MVLEDRLEVFLRVTLVFARVNAFADVLDVVFNEDPGEVFVAFDGNCACELVLLIVERVTTAILGALERRKWSRKQQVGCRVEIVVVVKVQERLSLGACVQFPVPGSR